MVIQNKQNKQTKLNKKLIDELNLMSEYSKLFISIWNTSIEKLNYRLVAFYCNGIYYKYIPFSFLSINKNICYSIVNKGVLQNE